MSAKYKHMMENGQDANIREMRAVEEGKDIQLDFGKLQSIAESKAEVLPVVVQDAKSGRVLVIAYADREALEYTLKNRIAAFYSTSRRELWIKGKTSGDFLDIVEVRVNCEQNSLLYLVNPRNDGSCHTKGSGGDARKSCYYRRIEGEKLTFLDESET